MADVNLLSAEIFVGYVALGFATGLYGTLIGAGGGFVLMPALLAQNRIKLTNPRKTVQYEKDVSFQENST